MKANLLGGIFWVLVLLFTIYSQHANAQQPTSLTKVIEEKFPPRNIEQSPGVSYLLSPVKVEYESPTTIMISGDLLYAKFNTDLWAAMDLLKNQYGFKVQQVMTSGVGSVGNPTTVYILMTK